MRYGWMGAAVAAGVMLCAGMGTAEAAPIYNIGLTLQVNFEGQGNGDPSNPVIGDYGSFVIDQLITISDLSSFEFFGPSFDIVGNLDNRSNQIYFSGFASATNIPVSGDLPGFGNINASISSGIADFQFSAGSMNVYNGSAQGGFQFSVDNTAFFGTDPGGIQASFTIGVVPLPASAPLFGSALLAMGGFAYAGRRGRSITLQA